MKGFAMRWLFFVILAVCTATSVVAEETTTKGNKWFIYELRSDYSGTQEKSSGNLIPGRYRVEVEIKDGIAVVVSDDGLLQGRNLTVAVPDERSRKLGFFDFLDSKERWDFSYHSSFARRRFYGTAKTVARGEKKTVPAGTFMADAVERVINEQSNLNNKTIYWYNHDLGAVIQLHHRLVRLDGTPDGTLVREIYYELADYGPKKGGAGN